MGNRKPKSKPALVWTNTQLPKVTKLHRSLYFAYGSNLHLEQMAKRCPLAQPLRKLNLKDWQLVFRGCADIEPAPGKVVPGALYTITPDCEKRLDRYEGFPRLYRKERFLVRIRNRKGKVRIEPTLFYRMNSDGYAIPSEHYVHVVAEGYRNWRLDLQKLVDALQATLDATKEEPEA